MLIKTTHCTIRSLRNEDAEDLAKHTNNRKIWLNMRDFFPHPYSVQDARMFIASVSSQAPECDFAIEVEGKAIGTIGFVPGKDVERISAEIGYWLAKPYWGQGIMSAVVRKACDIAITEWELARITAIVFEGNLASVRVLEKSGFAREARLKKYFKRDGVFSDALLFARVSG